MARKRRRRGRKSKFVTKRAFPFMMMKLAETKYLTFAISNVNLPINPSEGITTRSLINIIEGNGLNQRIGQMIQLTGIYVRAVYKAIDSDDTYTFRIGMHTPRIPGDVQLPFNNQVVQPQFEEQTMWFDKTMTVPNKVAPTPGGVLVIRKKFKPYMIVRYETNLGDSVTKGDLRLTLLPSSDAKVNVSYSARVYFKDV